MWPKIFFNIVNCSERALTAHNHPGAFDHGIVRMTRQPARGYYWYMTVTLICACNVKPSLKFDHATDTHVLPE